MTKRFLFFAMILTLPSIGNANGFVVQKYDVLAEAPYEFMVEKARASIKSYFVSLKENKLIDDLYSIDPSPHGRIYGPLLAGRLIHSSSPGLSCNAIFCKDPDVLALLEHEIRGGRLVLVSHDFTGYDAFVTGPAIEHSPMKSYFVNSDQQKSPMMVSPSATLDALKHELIHATDFELETLKDFYALTAKLELAGELDSSDMKDINRFLLEVRAYDYQRVFVIASHRPNEYESDRTADFKVSIHTVPSEKYKEATLHRINLGVKWHLDPMLAALKSPNLKAENKGKIISKLQKLMPQTGPYSFTNLIQPRL